MNETLEAFGFPKTLLAEYDHWVVLLRPDQVTAGSLVLACKGEVTRVPDVTPEAFAELTQVSGDLEAALESTFAFDKINYVLLMMVDKHVHWHVIPRYASAREAVGMTFEDRGWPAHPTIKEPVAMTAEQFAGLHALLKGNWP